MKETCPSLQEYFINTSAKINTPPPNSKLTVHVIINFYQVITSQVNETWNLNSTNLFLLNEDSNWWKLSLRYVEKWLFVKTLDEIHKTIFHYPKKDNFRLWNLNSIVKIIVVVINNPNWICTFLKSFIS